MDIKIRKTNISDLDSIMPVFDEARATIAALGIDQWQNGYPERDIIINDIDRSQSYLVELGGEIIATFALILDGEPDYDHIFDGEWQSGDKNKSYISKKDKSRWKRRLFLLKKKIVSKRLTKMEKTVIIKI